MVQAVKVIMVQLTIAAKCMWIVQCVFENEYNSRPYIQIEGGKNLRKYRVLDIVIV